MTPLWPVAAAEPVPGGCEFGAGSCPEPAQVSVQVLAIDSLRYLCHAHAHQWVAASTRSIDLVVVNVLSEAAAEPQVVRVASLRLSA